MAWGADNSMQRCFLPMPAELLRMCGVHPDWQSVSWACPCTKLHVIVMRKTEFTALIFAKLTITVSIIP